MKIGILTLPLHTNYGGILQAYALFHVLEKMGHDVYLIDTRFKKDSKWKSLKKYIKNLVRNDTKSKTTAYLNKIKHQSYLTYTKPFIDKYLVKVTEPFDNPKTMGKKIGKYNFEAYVVGSDQIWNPKYFKNIEIAFFSFLNDKKVIRISYAPSFGGDLWKYSAEKERICKDLVQKFKSVSVREDSGVLLCEKHLGIKASWVLDPTMLLSESDYTQIISTSGIKKNRGLFTYILDKNKDKTSIINSVANRFKLKPHELDFMEWDEPIPLEWSTKATVEDWIRNFYEAEFIVTDSFHGTVFSILFNKPFFSIINEDRGATRFQSLLKSFSLEDRMLSSFEDLKESILEKEINWKAVNQILDERRSLSSSFLSEGLKSI